MKKYILYLLAFPFCYISFTSCIDSEEDITPPALIVGKWQLTESSESTDSCKFKGYTEYRKNSTVIDNTGCIDGPVQTGTWEIKDDELLLTEEGKEATSLVITSITKKEMTLQGTAIVFIPGTGLVIRPVFYSYKKV